MEKYYMLGVIAFYLAAFAIAAFFAGRPPRRGQRPATGQRRYWVESYGHGKVREIWADDLGVYAEQIRPIDADGRVGEPLLTRVRRAS